MSNTELQATLIFLFVSFIFAGFWILILRARLKQQTIALEDEFHLKKNVIGRLHATEDSMQVLTDLIETLTQTGRIQAEGFIAIVETLWGKPALPDRTYGDVLKAIDELRSDAQIGAGEEIERLRRKLAEFHVTEQAYIRGLYKEKEALAKERDELAQWKEEAMSVMIPSDEVGEELKDVMGLTMGDSIHDKVLPGIRKLKAMLEEHQQALQAIVTHKMTILEEGGEYVVFALWPGECAQIIDLTKGRKQVFSHRSLSKAILAADGELRTFANEMAEQAVS